MIRIFFFIVCSCVLMLTACTKKKDCVVGSKDPNAICTMEYAPVCGCDNKTYSNACVAKGNGINEYTQGECKN